MGLFKKKKVILALGGGSARGLANIGVLKVFEKHFGRDKMPFDMIVGTSIGSLIGAAYCTGMLAKELESRSLKFNWPNMVDLGFYSTGLIKGDKLEKIITEMVDGSTFGDLKIPFALTTTNVETGEELMHTSGNLIKLIRASCSWPGIFTAVDIDGQMLADGGVRNSIPTKAAEELGATLIVAVNPGFSVKNQKIKNALQALVQSLQIMGEELNMYQSGIADIAIKPELKNIDQFDFDKVKIIIEQGEIAAEENMEVLKRKLKSIW